MDIVIWTYIFGGATIFALIVGIFSVWNGRMTRRELAEVIERSAKHTQEMIKDTADQTHKILERQGQMLGKIEETQRYIAELIKIEGEKTRSLITH
jgi:hypothetical protein